MVALMLLGFVSFVGGTLLFLYSLWDEHLGKKSWENVMALSDDELWDRWKQYDAEHRE